MKKVSEKQKSNNLIKAFCLLFITTSIVTTLSFSKFEKELSGGATTGIAAFVINATGNSAINVSLDPSANTNIATYKITVTNYQNNVISDVSIKYDLIVTLPKPLTDGIKMTVRDITPEISSDKLTYTFKNVGTFSAGTKKTVMNQLTFTADFDKLIYNTYSGIDIQVYAEQVD